MASFNKSLEGLALALHQQGRALIEAECERAIAAAMASASPEMIVDARTEVQLDACHGSGFRIHQEGSTLSVELCPCLRIVIVTRLPPEGA